MEVKKKEYLMWRMGDWLEAKGLLKRELRVAGEAAITSGCAIGTAVLLMDLKRGNHSAVFDIFGAVSLFYFAMAGAAATAIELKNIAVLLTEKASDRIKRYASTKLRDWRKAEIAVAAGAAVIVGAYLLYRHKQR